MHWRFCNPCFPPHRIAARALDHCFYRDHEYDERHGLTAQLPPWPDSMRNQGLPADDKHWSEMRAEPRRQS
jgi:hypothetical protein